MTVTRPALFCAVLFLAVGACDGTPATAPSGLPVVTMTIAGQRYHLEVAADEASRNHGLMERDEVAADHGMIFVFPEAAERNFWMKHTRIPLDIVYCRADGTVVSVATMKPYDESAVPSHGPATYAIELNAGQAKDTVKAGDRLAIPLLPATRPAAGVPAAG